MLHYETMTARRRTGIDGMRVGEAVGRLRRAKRPRMSRSALGALAHLDPQYIYRIERGLHPELSEATVEALARGLGVLPDELTEPEGNQMRDFTAAENIEEDLWKLAQAKARSIEEAHRLYDAFMLVAETPGDGQEKQMDYLHLVRDSYRKADMEKEKGESAG